MAIELYYPSAEDIERLRLAGVPTHCRLCGSLLPQRSMFIPTSSRRKGYVGRGGGRLREFCPDPGNEGALSSTTSCRVMMGAMVGMERHMSGVPFDLTTVEGADAAGAVASFLLALRNYLAARVPTKKERKGLGRQAKLF